MSVQAARLIAGSYDPLLANIIYHEPSIPTFDGGHLQESGNWGPFDEARRDHEFMTRKWRERLSDVRLRKTPEPEEGEQMSLDDREWPRLSDEASALLGGAKSTAEMHSLGSGSLPRELNYTPERMALQNEWIAEQLHGHSAHAQPVALVMAGGPASGKTSFLKSHPELLPPDAVDANADGAKYRLPEFRALSGIGDPSAANVVHAESGDMLHRLIQQTVAGRKNIVLDGTGNSGQANDGEPGDFRRQLQGLIDKGYKVRVLYVNETTAKSVQGSLRRQHDTGRHVPLSVVRRIHRNVSARFNDEIRHMPGLQSVTVVDHAHGLVYHHEAGEEPEIISPEGLEQFVAKADEPVDEAEGIREAAEPADEPKLSKPPVIWEYPLDWVDAMSGKYPNFEKPVDSGLE